MFKKRAKKLDEAMGTQNTEPKLINEDGDIPDVELKPGEKKSTFEKVIRIILLVAAFGMAGFHLYTAAFGLFPAMMQRGIHLALALLISYLMFVDVKKSKWTLLWVLPAIIGCTAAGLFGLESESMAFHVFRPLWYELAAGVGLIVLILVACYKQHGLVMPIILVIFLFYPLIGQHLTGMFATPAITWQELVIKQTFHTEGIFSTPLSTCANYIILFTIFGSFLEYTGTGQFIIDISTAALGMFRGGPAKIAVVSSALFGTVSGSAAANVVGTGTFTIPLMKKTGYRPEFAAAVEAAASTGGQIMPPVMGAASFIMAEFLGVPYSTVIKSAIVPAALFFIAVLFAVDLEACKNGLKGLPKSELPRAVKVLREGWYLAIPIILLLVLMMSGVTLHRSAFISIVAMVIISLITKRMKLSQIPTALFKGVASGVKIATLSAGAGIVVGTLAMTGLGIKLSSILITVANNNLMLLLLMTMLASLVFGMGMPTSPAYIILAVVVAPALVNMNIEPMAAHMFCFYFGIMSVITPPVAIAAYNGAGIAGCSPNKTGWQAVRIAAAGFIIPYMFVYSPTLLLIGDTLPIILNCCTALIGAYFLSVAMIGFFKNNLNIILRILMLAAAVLLIDAGYITDIIGITIGAAIMIYEIIKTKRQKKNVAPTAPTA
ncbi:MAG: TRAP transporter permease [Clostridia bacterium]|nr:TRAP transporter permease [Clostridia bacterium]